MENVTGFKLGFSQTEDIYEVRIYFKHLIKSVFISLFNLPLTNTKLISQYNKTYTLRSGLNHGNYLNIIKSDHVLATVRTRLHLASGWSNDHSGA